MSCPHSLVRKLSVDGVCPICAPSPLTPTQEVPYDRERREGITRGKAVEQLALVRAERSRRRFADFVRYSWPVLEPEVELSWNWHMTAVADHLQWMIEDWAAKQKDPMHVQRAQNMVINIPPGSAKSRIVSVCFPAWVWIHWPGWRALCLSANPDVALRDSMYCRQIIESQWYQKSFSPDWQLQAEQNAKSKFANTRGGERTARGMTAKVVGNRADAILIDDPNEAKEIYSEQKRQAVINAWDGGIWNRVNNPKSSIRIGVMQRLHDEDWTGHVLSNEDIGWEHLCIPMEFEPERRCSTGFGWEDPRTERGELLHEDRFPHEVLAKELIVLGSLGYAGQMQQSPVPAGGAIFKSKDWRWFRFEDQKNPRPRPPECSKEDARVIRYDDFEALYFTIDANFKGKITGDPVGFLGVGTIGADRFVFYNVTGKYGFMKTIKKIDSAVKDHPNYTQIIIEDKANGSAIIDTLKTKVGRVKGIEPYGGKEARAAAIEPEVSSGNVYLLEGAGWSESFVQEFSRFPKGKHDDQVDALSQLLIFIRSSPYARLVAMISTM